MCAEADAVSLLWARRRTPLGASESAGGGWKESFRASRVLSGYGRVTKTDYGNVDYVWSFCDGCVII